MPLLVEPPDSRLFQVLLQMFTPKRWVACGLMRSKRPKG